MVTTKKPWTAKHVNEAKAALYRLAADAAAKGDSEVARAIAAGITWSSTTATVGSFVAALALHLDPRVDAARILATVCARAEGREEVRYMVAWTNQDGARVHAWPGALGATRTGRDGAVEIVRRGVLKDASVLRQTITRRTVRAQKEVPS
jgi:hypothetical protein